MEVKVVKKILKNIDEEINLCNKCQNLVEKFPNSNTVYLGKNNDIIIIGEAPANNGWRISKMLWKNKEGKILPSGVVLQKLFDIIGKDIFDMTFIESIKCYPINRKNIKLCSKNCNKYLIEQLNILKPKIIITLGDAATRNVLNITYSKFSEVVGKVYNINNYKVIPIYHPSPISPKSYKDNIPIFEKLKDII